MADVSRDYLIEGKPDIKVCKTWKINFVYLINLIN